MASPLIKKSLESMRGGGDFERARQFDSYPAEATVPVEQKLLKNLLAVLSGMGFGNDVLGAGGIVGNSLRGARHIKNVDGFLGRPVESFGSRLMKSFLSNERHGHPARALVLGKFRDKTLESFGSSE